jgi:hypothetical protein
MSLPQHKKMFLKQLAYGFDAFSEQANRIGREPQGEVECFIKKHLLNHEYDQTYSFSKGKFMMSLAILDFEKLVDILIRLDVIGITIRELYIHTTLTTVEREFCKLIEDGEIETFRDFILY